MSSWDFGQYGNYGIEGKMHVNTVNAVPAEISRGPFRKSYRNSFCKTSLMIETTAFVQTHNYGNGTTMTKLNMRMLSPHTHGTVLCNKSHDCTSGWAAAEILNRSQATAICKRTYTTMKRSRTVNCFLFLLQHEKVRDCSSMNVSPCSRQRPA